MLESIGVDRATEAVYVALLNGGPADVPGLAAATAQDRATVRAALDRLAGLDLVSRADGRWYAFAPDLALEALVVREHERVLRRQLELETLRTEVARLARAARDRRPSDSVVEVVAGAEATRRHHDRLGTLAQREVLALSREPDPVRLDWLARGVTVRAVYEQEALEAPGRFDGVRRLGEAGEQARVVPRLPMTLVLLDQTHAVVHVEPGALPPDSAVVVHRSALLDGLVELFELLWERGVPLHGAPAPDQDERDRTLLAMLAAGFKDETIARQLGVSVSTVTRRTARLMQVAGSSTRFQLGMQAVLRGWV